jgi:hypothetical protein
LSRGVGPVEPGFSSVRQRDLELADGLGNAEAPEDSAEVVLQGAFGR